MQFKKIVVAASIMLAASMAMAEPTPKAVDLNKLFGVLKRPDIHL